MEIQNILDRLYYRIVSSENRIPMVSITLNDVRVLSNKSNLRMFRLRLVRQGVKFSRCASLHDCVKRLRKDGKDYFVLLQYCILFNTILLEPVTSVFTELKE